MLEVIQCCAEDLNHTMEVCAPCELFKFHELSLPHFSSLRMEGDGPITHNFRRSSTGSSNQFSFRKGCSVLTTLPVKTVRLQNEMAGVKSGGISRLHVCDDWYSSVYRHGTHGSKHPVGGQVEGIEHYVNRMIYEWPLTL